MSAAPPADRAILNAAVAKRLLLQGGEQRAITAAETSAVLRLQKLISETSQSVVECVTSMRKHDVGRLIASLDALREAERLARESIELGELDNPGK
jgi:hypothetical protein